MAYLGTTRLTMDDSDVIYIVVVVFTSFPVSSFVAPQWEVIST